MRTTMAMLLTLVATAASALAQSGPVQPGHTLGLGVGMFGAEGQDNDIGVSGTYEIPLSRDVRVRVDATRAAMPVSRHDPTQQADGSVETGYVTSMTHSAMRMRTPGLPASYFMGGGIGLYRATLRHSSEVGPGLHGYGGLEVRLSHRVSVSGELSVHLQAKSFDPAFNLPLGAIVRVKVRRR